MAIKKSIYKSSINSGKLNNKLYDLLISMLIKCEINVDYRNKQTIRHL